MSEILQWTALALVGWILPGIGYLGLLKRWLPPGTGMALAVALWAVPGLFAVCGLLGGPAGLGPRILLLVVIAPGLVLSLRRAAWIGARAFTRRHGLTILLAAALLGAVSWAVPQDVRFESDVLAHVAAVRNTIEEGRVFPVEGFHGDDASRGTDARFGVLHALYGVVCEITGTDPLSGWHRLRGIALALILGGALALFEVAALSGLALAVAIMALLFAFGGSYYNVLDVATYPLWCAQGLLWLLVALTLADRGRRPWATGAILGLGLGAAAAVHFFAFVLGGLLLASAGATVARARRGAMLRAAALATLIAAPLLALRTVVSYANANPIHHKVWECFEWVEGFYSADPVFMFQWLMYAGIVLVVWRIGTARRAWRTHLERWTLVTTVVALAWLSLPFVLTPSMAVLGFLPLRFIMAVPLPLLAGLMVDGAGRRRSAVALVLIVLMLPVAATRAVALFPESTGARIADAEWNRVVETIAPPQPEHHRVVLSDPFSMMAIRATSSAFVVAVPDGRSSPRDPLAIDRLRDAWRAMSASTPGPITDEILDRHAVTHILVNERVPAGLASYEYPMYRDAATEQRAKFDANPERFRLVHAGGGLYLYERSPAGSAPWNEDYLHPCLDVRVTAPEGAVFELGSGYVLERARLETSQDIADGVIRIALHGELRWTGTGSAPDRQLVVRLDHVPGPAPSALEFAQKPVRKIAEKLGRGPWRYRWTTYPGGGRCPLWLAVDGKSIPLDLELALPATALAGAYDLHLAARDLTVFTPVVFEDFLSDDDSFQGPRIGTVELD